MTNKNTSPREDFDWSRLAYPLMQAETLSPCEGSPPTKVEIKASLERMDQMEVTRYYASLLSDSDGESIRAFVKDYLAKSDPPPAQGA